MIDLTSRYNCVGYDTRALSTITTAAIHHMGTLGFVPNNESPIAQIDSINAYHRDHHGWPGIGYGIVVTDREWYLVNPLGRISWHVAFNNWYSVGFLILADFSKGGRPTAGHIKQLRLALAWVTKQVGRKLVVLGHKEFPQNATTCPGPEWFNWKPEVTRSEPRPGPEPVIAEPLDFAEVEFYALWALERLLNGQDPRNFMAFVEHLRGVGKDFRQPYYYGWPSRTVTRNSVLSYYSSDASFYASWALERIANKQDPRSKDAFVAHLRAIGKHQDPAVYGWPLP